MGKPVPADDLPSVSPRVVPAEDLPQPQSVEGTQTEGWTPYTPSGERPSEGGLPEAYGNLGEFAGRVGRQVGLTGRAGLSGLGLGSVANMVGLPQPANQTERVVGKAAETMAGMGGLAAGAGKLLTGAGATAAPYLKMLSEGRKTAITAAGTAGGAGQIAEESGADQYTKLGVELAAAAVTPTGVNLAKATGRLASDVTATIRTAWGSKSGLKQLEEDLWMRMSGDSRNKILDMLNNASKQIPGVKPTVSDVLGQGNLKSAEQVGGRIIRTQKDISGAASVEDILPSAVKGQDKALEAFKASVEAAGKPAREAALNRANASGGVNIKPVLEKINAIVAEPDLGASKLVTKSMEGVVKDLEAITKNVPGSFGEKIVDAKALYTIRKEIGNTIKNYSKETGNWDKRLTGGLERRIQLAIDDAIEASGGSGWKSYMKKYAARLQRVRDFEEGRGEAKRIAAQVKGQSPKELGGAEIPKLPTLLHRPMMFLNFALKTIGRDANEPLVKAATKTMQDPKALAAILRRDPRDPVRMKFEDILRQAAVVATIAASEADHLESGQDAAPEVSAVPRTLRGINSKPILPRPQQSPINPSPGFVRG